ncbi:MAG: STAS domain-containing protein, partial [Nostocales cyanobacterium]
MATKVHSFMSSQPTETNFPVTHLENTAIVQVSVRLSVVEAVGFKQTCQNLLQANSHLQKVIIDFQNTIFMDSSGLGAVVNNFKNAQEKGIAFTLCNVTPQVMAVLNLTGLDQVFSIESSQNIESAASENQVENRKVATRKTDPLPETHPSVASWMKRLIDIVGSLVGLVITA